MPTMTWMSMNCLWPRLLFVLATLTLTYSHTHTHTDGVHMCALNFPCLLLMSNFSVCKFTFFVSVFHFKRIFQIRLTKAQRRSEGREGGRGRGEWRTGRKTVDCWKFCYYARHCFVVNQLASFLPSPVLHSQQLNSCQLMLVFATTPSPSLPPLRHPWLTIFVGYCYILMRIYFSICVRESPLTPNCRNFPQIFIVICDRPCRFSY